MYSQPSQLLIRNQYLFEQGDWLLVNAEDPHVFSQIEADGFFQFYDQYLAARSTAKSAIFAAGLDTEKRYDGIVIYMPKAKQHAQMLLANMATQLKPNGSLMLVGENKGGIKASNKLLAEVGEHVVKHDSARHCSLFRTTITDTPKPFALKDWQQVFHCKIAQVELQICSLPGVFNHGHLDEGTQLLLENIHQVPEGEVLDFACGAGIVGAYLAKLQPNANISMSDINALALYCSEQTAQLNGFTANVVASDGLAGFTQQFAAIYTNPPFHTGIKTDYAITEAFLRDAKKHMLPQATLTLVANAFLKYPELFELNFDGFELLGQTSKFKVYFSQK
ncbi:class I SAM-dependent methyltransferase [Neptunicella marina]|uniref:Ribosomal RNA small subunit methyltransferase C n=1 Tax=Neptunicella marina TaxID=2125989 RepID=A0A8J6M4L5_9ALTE|nr:class I SAM-dependent methyltransferase [Neptunicella marina]MBC3766131.1 class I SAM-dependent methyltransferase [Neptunicella marina]